MNSIDIVILLNENNTDKHFFFFLSLFKIVGGKLQHYDLRCKLILRPIRNLHSLAYITQISVCTYVVVIMQFVSRLSA